MSLTRFLRLGTGLSFPPTRKRPQVSLKGDSQAPELDGGGGTPEARFESSHLKRSLFIDFGGAVTLTQTRGACLGAGGGGASAESSVDSGLRGLPPQDGCSCTRLSHYCSVTGRSEHSCRLACSRVANGILLSAPLST